MSRRALKPFAPLLVGLIAVVLGFLAIGPSFADTGVAPVDGPIATIAPSPSPAASPAASPASPVVPPSPVVVSPSTSKPPKAPKTDASYGPKDCPSCMVPPGE